MKGIHALPRTRLLALGALPALLLGMLGAAPVAATSSLTFETTIGNGCVSINGAEPDQEVKFVMRDSAGGLLLRIDLTADSTGDAFYCSDVRVLAGYKLRAMTSSDEHTLVVPEVSIRLNRVTDRLRGTGPAGATLKIVCNGVDPFRHFEPCIWTRKVTVGSDGPRVCRSTS